MKTTRTSRIAAALALGAFVTLSTTSARAAGAEDFFKNPQHGNPSLKSIGSINFGPQGLLLVAEPGAASIVAIATGDAGPVQKLKKKVDDVTALAAARLGAPADGVRIVDMTVNPASGKIYLACVRNADKQVAILTVNADGQCNDLAMDKATYVRVPLPAKDATKITAVSDVAFAKDRVLVAGQSNEEFSSKIFNFPLPLTHAQSGKVFSAETYHISHGRWETKAPIQSFIPYEENGKHYLVGAFACTPIAKFPLDDIESGAAIRGTSVMELGSGNRPLDMFTYEKNGKSWVVANTVRFKQNLFGPSKYWGVRVALDYLTGDKPEKINERAPHRDEKAQSGPNGVEVLESLHGAVHIAKLNNDEMVVLRESGSTFSLELATLP